MIQSSIIIATESRNEIVNWPLVGAEALKNTTGITRCRMIFSKDGLADVTIDSNNLPLAFNFTGQRVINGKLTQVMRWRPGMIVQGYFTDFVVWTGRVFLYDSTHADGAYFGEFLMRTGVPANVPDYDSPAWF